MWPHKLPHHSTPIKGISTWLHECWTPHCSVLTAKYDIYTNVQWVHKEKPTSGATKLTQSQMLRLKKTENCTTMKQERKRRRQRKIERLAEIFARKTDERVVSPERRIGQTELLTSGDANRDGVKTKNLELLTATVDLITVSVTDDGHRSDFYGICNKNEVKDWVVSLRGVTNDCVRRFKRSWRITCWTPAFKCLEFEIGNSIKAELRWVWVAASEGRREVCKREWKHDLICEHFSPSHTRQISIGNGGCSTIKTTTPAISLYFCAASSFDWEN